jgi:hypothetical protein
MAVVVLVATPSDCCLALVTVGTADVCWSPVPATALVVAWGPLVVGPAVVVGAGVVGTQHSVALADPWLELAPGGQGVQVSLPSIGLYVAFGHISQMPSRPV